MTRFVSLILILFFSFAMQETHSQNKNRTPCSAEPFKQFDFWVGNWNVYNVEDKLIGTNKIVKMSNACAIQENWESKTSNSKGTSYNYYNGLDKSWNQVWIDNNGGSLVLKGFFKNNQMILKSDVVKNPKGNHYNQITWTQNSDGSVTQLWEVFNEHHKKTGELFRGKYIRQ